MLSVEDHLESLTRHIDLVRSLGLLMGKRLMARGKKDFGVKIISRCYRHDLSKFSGIEWKYLHAGKDVPKELLDEAIWHHANTNDHHPEFSGGINQMCEPQVCEMIVDWTARCQERGVGVRDWIENCAIKKFSIDKSWVQYQWMMEFVDILLEDDFVKKD